MPAVASRTDNAAPLRIERPRPKPVQRILVVEDNPELRETLGLLLEDADREVVACASAEEALMVFANAPFDVVFTDHNLPRMSGLELATRVHDGAPQTWVVLTSGGAFTMPLAAARRRLRLLAKPFSLDALEGLLHEFDAAATPGR